MCPTFVSAVSEGARAADGPRPFLQGVCAATQWVTLSVQVKRVLSRDAVGAAHAAAAWRQVILADVSGAHCRGNTHTHRSVLYLLNASEIIHAGDNHQFTAGYN